MIIFNKPKIQPDPARRGHDGSLPDGLDLESSVLDERSTTAFEVVDSTGTIFRSDH